MIVFYSVKKNHFENSCWHIAIEDSEVCASGMECWSFSRTFSPVSQKLFFSWWLSSPDHVHFSLICLGATSPWPSPSTWPWVELQQGPQAQGRPRPPRTWAEPSASWSMYSTAQSRWTTRWASRCTQLICIGSILYYECFFSSVHLSAIFQVVNQLSVFSSSFCQQDCYFLSKPCQNALPVSTLVYYVLMYCTHFLHKKCWEET